MYPSSIGSWAGQSMSIWNQWSITERVRTPIASAVRAKDANVGPMASGPPGQVNVARGCRVPWRPPVARLEGTRMVYPDVRPAARCGAVLSARIRLVVDALDAPLADRPAIHCLSDWVAPPSHAVRALVRLPPGRRLAGGCRRPGSEPLRHCSPRFRTAPQHSFAHSTAEASPSSRCRIRGRHGWGRTGFRLRIGRMRAIFRCEPLLSTTRSWFRRCQRRRRRAALQARALRRPSAGAHEAPGELRAVHVGQPRVPRKASPSRRRTRRQRALHVPLARAQRQRRDPALVALSHDMGLIGLGL